ncbi:conserved hypothetical protein [Ricinus communis]|uniref:Cytochrome P450 n=1 Tax=Ricinus communis TaxID=3988 RepID=B9R7M1_RICCO|nr:conserved hypothetical protein [Ricinus communis]
MENLHLPYTCNGNHGCSLDSFRLCVVYIKINEEKESSSRAGGAWPIIGHLHLLVGPQPPHIVLGNMADKCAPIFSIKMGVHRTLVLSNWEVAKECFTTNDRAFANRPNILAMDLLGYGRSIFGFSSYGNYWRQIRKISTPELLSNHRLQMFKHVREFEVGTASKELYKLWGKNKRKESNEGWKQAIRDFFHLSGKSIAADAGTEFELIPFGSGRRMCPGVSFALQVLQLTLATLLHGFDFARPTSEPIDMTESIVVVVQTRVVLKSSLRSVILLLETNT